MKSSITAKILIAGLIFVIGVLLTETPAVKKLDFAFLDWMMISQETTEEPSTIVVALDQYTTSIFGWPLDKSLYAALISVLHDAGAEKIGFDLFFDSRQEAGDEETLEKMIAEEDFLGETGIKTGTIFGSYINRDFQNDPARISTYPATPKNSIKNCNCIPESEEGKQEKKFSYIQPLVPGIAKHSPQVAHVHIIPSEVDRVNRTVLGCKNVFDGTVPDLALAMTGLRSGKEDCFEQIVPYFRKAAQFDTISIFDVISATESDEKLAELKKRINGKYVLLGATDKTLKDVGPTPSGDMEPLVYVHANRLEAFLNDVKIRELPVWINYIFVFFLLASLILVVKLARYYLIYTAVSIPLLFFLSFAVFRTTFYFIHPMAALLPLVFTMIGSASYIGWKYFLFNQVLSNAFDDYVSPEILKWLKDTGGESLKKDSAQRREISILFSDIAGYTSLSNSLNAESIMKSLELYLDEMMKITADCNGYVDKINGDGLMILFGAPKPFEDHAQKALECALKMQKRVTEMQEQWQEITGRELKIRIGVATDRVFVGNLGGKGHIEYSAIGRGVNLAARLEKSSDEGGILVSEMTLEKAMMRPHGKSREVELKGYENKVKVWQISSIDIENTLLENGETDV